MSTTLCLVRHGRAHGQGPDVALMPEGEAYVATLGRKLAREGFAAAAAYSSPYRRARQTANILLGELGATVPLVTVRTLAPEAAAADALEALLSLGLPAGRVLVVTHLPLVGQLAERFTDEHVDFLPGTFVEIELDAGGTRGVLRRTIGPDDLSG